MTPLRFCRALCDSKSRFYRDFPDPAILAVFDFLAFFVSRFPLLFCAFFLSKDFRGSAKRKALAFFRASLALFKKKSKGWRVRVEIAAIVILRFGHLSPGASRPQGSKKAQAESQTSQTYQFPDPPVLAFFGFPCFFRSANFLAFLCMFPFFSKD